MQTKGQDKVSVYLSHPIRGHATENIDEAIKKNNEIAKHYAGELRHWFPTVEFYVPAEHDDFPQAAMDLGMLSVDEVLAIDVKIAGDCDVLLMLRPPEGASEGQTYEWKNTYHACSSEVFDVAWTLDDRLSRDIILYLAWRLERISKTPLLQLSPMFQNKPSPQVPAVCWSGVYA
ncbi:MAG: hypothetical protein WCR98_02860 [Saccharofermentanales bacterium]